LVIHSDAPIFLAIVAVHVLVALGCVAAGPVAMLSRKGPGRHPLFGTVYYWLLSVACASAAALSAMRWAEDSPLFVLGALSFAAASVGRTAMRRRWRNWARLHIGGMGLSYVILVTAFYVDNGPNLPLWKDLPSIAYWVVPGAIGVPLIVRARFTHPLARRAGRPAQSS